MNGGHKPAGRRRKIILLMLLLVVIPGTFFIVRSGTHHFNTLPYYGPREANAPGDTTYFTVPPFAFIDQNGRTVSDKSLEGRILVVDFFFTRCTTICPRMTANMQRLQLELTDPAKRGSFKDVVFLSHTVDPEHDTPEVLRKYARQHEADTTLWRFVTGPKEDLYRQGAEGYFLAAAEDVLAPDGFLHSEKFVLIDGERHIRGFYDGTDPAQVTQLSGDLKLLVAEAKRKEREAKR